MGILVSILIPAYNAERWIAETIRSALHQTWPWTEVIVVDDGSCDKTYSIAQGFEGKRVKVVRQANGGGCAARNRALALAQGDYIQWLDADDLLGPEKIAKQVQEIYMSSLSPQTLLTSKFGIFFYRPEKAVFEHSSLFCDLLPIEWLIRKFSENVWMNPATWLMSRELADKAGPWDERLVRDQDGEYICRVLTVTDWVKFVPQAKSYYRTGNFSSLSTDRSRDTFSSIVLSTRLCLSYLLTMEDSMRTREAGLKYLQHRLTTFDLKYIELLRELNQIAIDLGGEITQYYSEKDHIFLRWFNRITKRNYRFVAPKVKIFMKKNLDWLAYEIEKSL